MSNPYKGKPDYTFWGRAVADLAPDGVDPVTHVPFKIGRGEAVATAGSCFAQHIARTLQAQGFNYLVSEAGPASDGAIDEGYGLFSARFGNIYTVRQLLQLFDRAYGLFVPADSAWSGRHGGVVDPFRPQVQEGGFADAAAMEADRQVHLAAVRAMFETCSVFIFTLGLTEGWVSTRDGAVFPLAPGVGGLPEDPALYAPRNFKAAEMIIDLEAVLAKLKAVNPSVRVILTVSPVPLIATFEDRHVVVSTSYSKAALRVTAEEVSAGKDWVSYFPSYEIVTAPYAGNQFEEDQRSVKPAAVARVMTIFSRHFLGETRADVPTAVTRPALSEADRVRFRQIDAIVCDEEAIVSGLDS